MSITKLKTTGHWALPPANHDHDTRRLTGRVIVGILTAEEAPVPTNLTPEVITSAKDRRRR